MRTDLGACVCHLDHRTAGGMIARDGVAYLGRAARWLTADTRGDADDPPGRGTLRTFLPPGSGGVLVLTLGAGSSDADARPFTLQCIRL